MRGRLGRCRLLNGRAGSLLRVIGRAGSFFPRLAWTLHASASGLPHPPSRGLFRAVADAAEPLPGNRPLRRLRPASPAGVRVRARAARAEGAGPRRRALRPQQPGRARGSLPACAGGLRGGHQAAAAHASGPRLWRLRPPGPSDAAAAAAAEWEAAPRRCLCRIAAVRRSKGAGAAGSRHRSRTLAVAAEEVRHSLIDSGAARGPSGPAALHRRG